MAMTTWQILELVGYVAITLGIGLMYLPAGVILGGGLLLLVAWAKGK